MKELLFFRPQTGTFDTGAVEHYVEQLGHAFRDPGRPHVFVVYADESAADLFRQLRQQTPDGRLPFTLLISVQPDTITVGQLADKPELALARQFVEWLLEHYDCVVEDDDGEDLTAMGKASLDDLYPTETSGYPGSH